MKLLERVGVALLVAALIIPGLVVLAVFRVWEWISPSPPRVQWMFGNSRDWEVNDGS